jgi:outer membrane protein OmpA-like peptidoglycan-associated protein
MVFLWFKGRRGTGRRQPGGRRAALACLLVVSATGCGNTSVSTPVDWWHDLQGGVIAARRPAPPGADLPYPHMGPIPEKPAEPDKAARAALLDQLASERDNTQRAAARNPIAVLPPPPPPPPKPEATGDQTANASLPAAEAAPPPPAPKQVAPPSDGKVIIAGSGEDESDLPPIAEAPPPPATFEGVAAEPMPTPPPPPAPRALEGSGGEHVLFPTGQATLAATQLPTLKEVASHRHGQTITIEGHGEAVSDTPEGQAAAIALGLKRAEVIADALVAQHVPQSALRLGADAFGRGASVRVGS